MKWELGIDRKYPTQIVDATYGSLTAGGFATKMNVVLGPAAGMIRAGSSTRRGSLGGIMGKLVQRDGLLMWAAGHLLNAELGGDGMASKNLAPLTQTANKQHSGHELKVKRLCIVARQKQELQSGPLTFYYGVKYSVETVSTFGSFDPYDKVPSHLVISANVYKYDLDGSNERALTSTEQSWFAADSFTSVQIHNRDEHLGH